MLDFIKNISSTELIIIGIILIILFGGKIITKLARTTGETFREAKKIKKEFRETVLDEKPRKK